MELKILMIYINTYDRNYKHTQNFNLFDWCKVIENPKEIHTIYFSIILILEKIKINVLYLYSRRENNLSEVDYLLK